jgi:hypothetical protein
MSIYPGANLTIENLRDGWIQPNETWSYSSWNSSTKIGVITVPSDATQRYARGMRIRITQQTGGTKYGIITAVTSTTITVYFGPNYTLNNEAIINPAFTLTKELCSYQTSRHYYEYVTSNKTYIDITNLIIDRGFNHTCYFSLNLRNAATSTARFSLFFNGNYTQTNYYTQYLTAAGTGISAARENNSTIAYLSSTEKGSITGFIQIATDSYAKFYCSVVQGPPSGILLNYRASATNFTCNPITSIRLSSDQTNGISADSIIHFWIP